MRHESFTFDHFVVVIFYHDDSSNLLLEAKNKGQSLIGTYSVIHHQPHTPDGDYHLHVYNGQNQIFAINKNGTSHDSFHGVRIPNKVYGALTQKFGGWMFPPNQIIETVNYTYFLNPIVDLSYRQILKEIDIIQNEINTLDIFENTKGLLMENVNINIQIDALQQRIKELFVQSYKRIE